MAHIINEVRAEDLVVVPGLWNDELYQIVQDNIIYFI